MLLSVVAPCMNEQEVLSEFYHRMKLAIIDGKFERYEIILVDDGSKDHTWNVIEKLHRVDNRVRGIKLSRNFGHQAALTAGLDAARGEYIFIIDSDLQDPPELLNQMMEKLSEGYDVVYGQRILRYGETLFKKVSANLFYRCLSCLADVDIPRDTGDFRLISRKVLLAYQSLSEGQRFTRGLIAWLGFKQTSLPYIRNPRFAGSSKYPLKKMIHFSLDAVTSFSLKPLRAIIFSGVVICILSFLSLLYLSVTTNEFQLYFLGIISLICGVQVFCLGIIGEYVGRTFLESKKRPLYLIESTTLLSLNLEEESKFYLPEYFTD
ncbi:MAG: glycosyltransferase family 2 protein [Bacteriovoracaceae bacterium]